MKFLRIDSYLPRMSRNINIILHQQKVQLASHTEYFAGNNFAHCSSKISNTRNRSNNNINRGKNNNTNEKINNDEHGSRKGDRNNSLKNNSTCKRAGGGNNNTMTNVHTFLWE